MTEHGLEVGSPPEELVVLPGPWSSKYLLAADAPRDAHGPPLVGLFGRVPWSVLEHGLSDQKKGMFVSLDSEGDGTDDAEPFEAAMPYHLTAAAWLTATPTPCV